MINGAHAIIYSTAAEADRAFLRDILGLPHVDMGGGWLIFGLPPSEIAVHPTDGEGGTHELYFMCPDVEELKLELAKRGIESSPVADQGWGLVTQVTLPGGSNIGVYEPRHARPESAPSLSSSGARKRKAARSGAAKAGAGAARSAKKKKKKALRAMPAKAAKAPKPKKSSKKKAGKRGRA